MDPLITEVATGQDPESLVEQAGLANAFGTVLLHWARPGNPAANFSLVATNPFQTFSSRGKYFRIESGASVIEGQGDPWLVLDQLITACRLEPTRKSTFPLGCCCGFWGYDLKRFVEPRLCHRAPQQLSLPECQVFFFASLVVFDHSQSRVWIIATGLDASGGRSAARQRDQLEFWRALLSSPLTRHSGNWNLAGVRRTSVTSSTSKSGFMSLVSRAQEYIRAGDIYQVNLSHRLMTGFDGTGWELYRRLRKHSPAPHAAYLNGGSFQIVSASPELFLHLDGRRIVTRPIKGTRARSMDLAADLRLERELRESPKERAELVMITDLLRNDLGRVCEFGSVRATELATLEKFTQVQHLVSTVEGQLRRGITHMQAVAACFPGGSITGAPKCRAMEIIDELETVPRGPYTGACGCFGFNDLTFLNMIIRTALREGPEVTFHVGAGIVADSLPEAEYEETLQKARGMLLATGALEGGQPIPTEIPAK